MPIGYYLRIETPVSGTWVEHDDYCGRYLVTVPEDASRFSLTFSYEPINQSRSGAGFLGISAQSPSHNQWDEAPRALDAEGWVAIRRTLSFDQPEPGTWLVYAYTLGTAVQQAGNLEIHVEGNSAVLPEPLAIREDDCRP